MAPKPPLTDSEVLEILRLYKGRTRIEAIAEKFDRSTPSIRAIVDGTAYRHVTAGKDHQPGECACARCKTTHCEDENLDIAEFVEGKFRCVRCGDWVATRVAAVLRAHGRAMCGRCDTRRRR